LYNQSIEIAIFERIFSIRVLGFLRHFAGINTELTTIGLRISSQSKGLFFRHLTSGVIMIHSFINRRELIKEIQWPQ